jgi:predicted nucleotidyltransferase
MPRIDDCGPVITLDAGRRRALADLFQRQPDVVAAYLFGSQARGDAGPLSDVDLAVWLDDRPEPARRLRRQLALSGEAASLLGTDEVELVVLNGAPPLLAQRVIRDGELLAERSAPARVRLETDAVIRYLDTIPLREELGRGLERRLAEGTFGRPRGS